MRISYYSLIALTVLLWSTLLSAQQIQKYPLAQASTQINHPYPNHTTYTSGTIKPSRFSQKELDQQVATYYEQWKKEYLRSVAKTKEPLYRIAFGKEDSNRSNITVSEGQGYGMIITVLMAGHDPKAQTIFNGLFGFVKAHPSKYHTGLMAWKVNVNDNYVEDSAFDGDADIAYALLLADKQWGSKGTLNYRLYAEIMIDHIYKYTIGPYSKLPMLGDWVTYNGKVYNQFSIRSSDLMLSNFHTFDTVDKRWETVLKRAINTATQLQNSYAPQSMLLPDFFVLKEKEHFQPAPKDFLEGKNDGAYYYNACRTPLRLGIYTLLHSNATLHQNLSKLSQWLKHSTHSNVEQIHSGYALSGKPLPNSNYQSSLFVSTFGIAAMHNPKQQKWLNAIYSNVYKEHTDYYEDSVTLLSLLVMSGNYWD